jgi:trimethylamine--corrinoid protein Co-methyltransferase
VIEPFKSLAGQRIIGTGGNLTPLDERGIAAIHAAALELLASTGISEAPSSAVKLVTDAGGRLDDAGRLLFPEKLVEAALAGLQRDFTLYGRAADTDLVLAPGAVHVGTGGASPQLFDMQLGRYRDSCLADLYDAARLVDRLTHIHFFSRPLVARDMPDQQRLDVNTAYASLAGTTKHVFVSAGNAQSVADIARLCYRLAGSEAAFRERPFLSLLVNHAVPPMRFDTESVEILQAAVRHGIPMSINTFGQLGASSPVTIAGCVAQTTAETLAGMVIAWLVDEEARAVFGPRPMITDLRTGAMAGGSGEQALLTATAMQMARHYGLPSSTIAWRNREQAA